MSYHGVRHRNQDVSKTLSSLKKDDEFDENALYLLEGLKDILKKSNVNKNHAQSRHCSSNSDYFEDSEVYYEDNEELVERKERNEREHRYMQHAQKHIQKVHKELCDINNKLQHENKRLRILEKELQRKEAHLDDVENELSDYAASLKEVIEKEMSKQKDELIKEFELKMKEVNAENKKLRNSFKILKKANDTYKSKAEVNDDKIKSYELKNTSSLNRISNLQRKIEILNQQLKQQMISPTFYTAKERVVDNNSSDKKAKNDGTISPSFCDVFGALLQWVSDSHLKQNINNVLNSDKLSNVEHDVTTELTNEKCMKVIICLPTLFSQIYLLDDHIQLSILQFIYWSMFHIHISQSSQKFSHSATYRRIGEELYQGKHLVKTNNQEVFFKSRDAEIRLLSTLVIMYTITQADILANAFQMLNMDLRQEQCKSHFIAYRGTFILLPLFKLTNKVNLSNTKNILMVMATESPFLEAFLQSLSSVEWIQAIMTTMRTCQDDSKLMEELSLLLQRLSKLKSNKPILDALQVKSVVSEFVRNCSPNAEFLQLNLRSVLYNIESMKLSSV